MRWPPGTARGTVVERRRQSRLGRIPQGVGEIVRHGAPRHGRVRRSAAALAGENPSE